MRMTKKFLNITSTFRDSEDVSWMRKYDRKLTITPSTADTMNIEGDLQRTMYCPVLIIFGTSKKIDAKNRKAAVGGDRTY